LRLFLRLTNRKPYPVRLCAALIMRLAISLLIDTLSQNLNVNEELFADLPKCPGQAIMLALNNGPAPGFFAVKMRVFFGDIARRDNIVERCIDLSSSRWAV
jgi:hypothetical protein